MISALDTNVLLDVLIPNPDWLDRSVRAIETAASTGNLVICDIVYAEVCCQFGSKRECDSFLEENHIRVERISGDALFAAATAWRQYRRKGGKRERILPDFLVGAHAHVQASQLVSRDGAFFQTCFPGLAIRNPSAAS